MTLLSLLTVLIIALNTDTNMFISDADLSTVLNERQLLEVITPNTSNRNRAENYAIDEASYYLNFQYDTDTIFGYKVFDYDATAIYTIGQIVINSDALGFTCIQDAPVGTALTDSNYFEEGEARNPLIVMIVVDIFAYHLFSRTGTNRIPQHIIDRYEMALKKLKEIRKQTMNPLLP